MLTVYVRQNVPQITQPSCRFEWNPACLAAHATVRDAAVRLVRGCTGSRMSVSRAVKLENIARSSEPLAPSHHGSTAEASRVQSDTPVQEGQFAESTKITRAVAAGRASPRYFDGSTSFDKLSGGHLGSFAVFWRTKKNRFGLEKRSWRDWTNDTPSQENSLLPYISPYVFLSKLGKGEFSWLFYWLIGIVRLRQVLDDCHFLQVPAAVAKETRKVVQLNVNSRRGGRTKAKPINLSATLARCFATAPRHSWQDHRQIFRPVPQISAIRFSVDVLLSASATSLSGSLVPERYD
jgi:hypothetical protein